MKKLIRVFVDAPLLCALIAGAVIGMLDRGWLLAVCGVAAGVLRLLAAFVMSRRRPPKRRRRGKPDASAAPKSTKPPKDESGACAADGNVLSEDDSNLVVQMLAQGRGALLLRPTVAENLSDAEIYAAKDALDEAMALTPEGDVIMISRSDHDEADQGVRVRVEAMFLDRFAVTNRDFQHFVDSGGYQQMSLWRPEVWPAVVGLADQTGCPGPKYWQDGVYPKGKGDHPVVGVSWYEADAYARWVGKRLPTDPEWVKAASWPVSAGSGPPNQRRFPWGEAFDGDQANLWSAGPNATVPVDQYEDGDSVAGVRQLIGNVWEWTSSGFGVWSSGRKIETETGMKSIRGGGYDTYFDNQATCHFQSGDSPLARKHNIGFRCAVGVCDLAIDCVASNENEFPEEEEAISC